jgi:hypothetical protein
MSTKVEHRGDDLVKKQGIEKGACHPAAIQPPQEADDLALGRKAECLSPGEQSFGYRRLIREPTPTAKCAEILHWFKGKAARHPQITWQSVKIDRHPWILAHKGQPLVNQVGAEIGRLRTGSNEPEHRDVAAGKVLERGSNRGCQCLGLQAGTYDAIEGWKGDIGGHPAEIRLITEFGSRQAS